MLPLAIVAGLAILAFALRLAAGSVDSIRAEMNALRDENDAIIKAAKATNRDLTEEETAKITANSDRHDELQAELEAAEVKIEATAKTLARAEAQAEWGRQSRGRPTSADAATSLDGDKPVTSGLRENLQDDPRGGFETMGHLGLAVAAAFGPNAVLDERFRVRSALTQGDYEAAGILVPPAYSDQIWTEAQGMSDSLMNRCAQWTCPPNRDSITVPAINETSRADGSRWGGVQGYWKDELSQMSATNPVLRGVKLEPEELYVFVDATDKLIRNAPQVVSQLINVCAPDEINFKIGDAIMNGDGAGQPLGILNAAAKIEVAKVTDQAADTVLTQNVVEMHARMQEKWRRGAVWLIDQSVEPQLDLMTIPVGTGGTVTYLPPSGIVDGAPGRLKGKPVDVIEYCPVVGDAGDITFTNFRAYAVCMKGGVRSAVSMHLYFDYARTAFRFMVEMDGQPIVQSALTPKSGGDTLSPIVTLAARA